MQAVERLERVSNTDEGKTGRPSLAVLRNGHEHPEERASL